MGFVSLNSADVANAQLGINLPVAYGYVRAQGNEILNHSLDNKNRIVIRILGEGEWDGIDTLFINSNKVNAADTSLVHFHPGVDGELGHGLSPDSNGGDQRVDNFWSQLPANFQPTTFSRKSYLMANVPPDPAAPSAQLTLVGDYRAMKVRQFDASGTQTGYAFSTNGAEQALDAILRSALKPEWNPSAAAAGGGDLISAEKARIDFASFADSVSWCNTLLANGLKRFESSLAIVSQTSLIDALKQLCVMSQLYITEAAGVIYIRADKPRASSFILTSNHIMPGTAYFDKKNLHGAQNRFIPSFNDLNAQGIADIDLPANNGLARSGAGVVTVQCKTNHPFSVGQNVQIVPPQDGSVHESAFDGVFPIASSPGQDKFTYAQGGNANWLLWSEKFDKTQWQKTTNVTVTPNNQTDPLGGGTADTISTGVTAAQGVFQNCVVKSQNGVNFTFSIWLKAAANTAATLQIARPGADLESLGITVTNIWTRFTVTHTQTWTGVDTVQVLVIITNANASIFAWGAQIEDGAQVTAYRQTTGENYLLWSERFDNSVWQKQTNVTVAANNQVDPLGGNTADTVSTGATAGVGIFQNSLVNSLNGLQFTFSIWLKAAANTAVTLFMSRPGADNESLAITVTNVWTRFSITHSATWTGVGAVQAVVAITNAGTSIFAWGAQLEIGAAVNAYIQTADIVGGTNGARSGNGTVGTPESRFAVKGSPVIDHLQHQNAIGQRGLSLTPIFRAVPATVNLGNNTVERAGRILKFLLARSLGIDTTPYSAPWTGTITCFMDAVDASNRALISQLCGDIITVDATVSEEGQGDYEITKMVYIVPAADGSGGSNSRSNAATIELTVLQYLSAAFSDASLVSQAIRASIPSGLVPIAQVDSLGIQRLASSLRNNPLNVQGFLTGANPLTQSGASTTINVASFTVQFGFGQVSYNSGSVNPGPLGTWAVYFKDPKFTGGSVTFLATQSQHVLTADDGNILVGIITTVTGGSAGGTGYGTGLNDSGSDVLPTR